jgi:hypothetical protein
MLLDLFVLSDVQRSHRVVRRRRCRAAAHAATPPRAVSDQAMTTIECAPAGRCFPASPSPPTSINRPEPSLAGASSAQKSRPGASRQNRSFSRGLSAKTVTQVNSTNSAVFLFLFLFRLELWKFIANHRKIIK